MVSRYLHSLFPSIELKESEQYLNNCAFSSSIQNFQFGENIQGKPRKTREHLKFLGGPSSLTFDSSSAFVIQNIKNRGYYLISSNGLGNTEKFFLSHGEIIYAVISKGNRQVLLKNLKIQDIYKRTIDFNLISLMFNLKVPQRESGAFLSKEITMHDARLLSYLGSTGRNIIHHFLHDETRNFLHKNTSIIVNDKPMPSSIDQVHENNLNIAPKILHENYAKSAPTVSKKSRGVNRKHAHSRYTFQKKKRVFSLYAQDEEDNTIPLIIQLSNHLNEQLKSFFHTSTIQISIIEIGKITINE